MKKDLTVHNHAWFMESKNSKILIHHPLAEMVNMFPRTLCLIKEYSVDLQTQPWSSQQAHTQINCSKPTKNIIIPTKMRIEEPKQLKNSSPVT